jgi:hypothetical protein
MAKDYEWTQEDQTPQIDAEANAIGEATRDAEEWGDICPDCDGSGALAGCYDADDGMTTCNRCGGKGTI